jgi:type IV pilus assembly protein PilY1
MDSIRKTLLPPTFAAALMMPTMASAIDLADSPLFSTVSVPGNLILALSVEWPTATTPAYPSDTTYTRAATFIGYFDPAKCYVYVQVNSGSESKPDYSTSYFKPHGPASDHACSSGPATALWSGNYLNWASMQTLDAFRSVLTGGYRSVDTPTSTVLTKTYAAMDTPRVIPDKTVSAAELAGATPFGGSRWSNGAATRIRNLGTRLWITGNVSEDGDGGDGLVGSSATTGAVPYKAQNAYADKGTDNHAKPNKTYELYVNVKVCDRKAGLEDNCVGYGPGDKPEGLMQQYSSRLRYSAFGYYNHSGDNLQQRDGGVMRARMKYIGPRQPVPGSATIGNGHAEWHPGTGVMAVNPDPEDADATRSLARTSGWSVDIANSGVMNYLNKFGYSARSYKEKDPVSELYYAALRYYKNLGNVGSYTTLANAGSSATAALWLDGFPAITSDDVWKKSPDSETASFGSPILYSCQKNFVLGIGDVNTHRDANLNGSTLRNPLDAALPPEVSAESTATITDVNKATNMVGQLEGLKGGALGELYSDSDSGYCWSEWNRCGSYFIAGLAYDAHTRDIRTDLTGVQTVNTYWMDVLEREAYKHKNQYWLAAKYGGFQVPSSFLPYDRGNGPKTLDDKTWTTTKDTLRIQAGGRSFSTDTGSLDKRPDNYFPGDRPETMRSGLTKAFAKIVSETEAATATALSTGSPNVVGGANINYATSYSPKDWTGQLSASKIVYAADGTPKVTELWNARSVLDASVTDTDTSARKIVTCCSSKGAALPFTAAALSGRLHPRTDLASFAKVTGVDDQSAANFIAYLRGARGQEMGNGGAYRTRNHLLGDIVNAKPAIVGGPSAPYYDVTNPGYSAFKRERAGRKTVVYVGANDGMLHAFDGSESSTEGGGKELFAYIPSFVYGTGAGASAKGLASLGNPSYSHHYFVDATPQVFDVDLARAGTQKATANSTDWHSLLIGGLGKGGNGYYAIDVTNPADWTGESEVAAKVLWEFADSRMGYSYGAPSVVKTRRFGWVALFTAGYDNADGKGWFFFVNPATGALLDAVSTPEGSASAPLNMAHHTAFVPDYTDATADAVYAADLQGNVWRVDLTGTGAYDPPVKVAKLTGSDGTPQPVTTRPLVEVEPGTNKRYLMLGTGRLLADSDILNGHTQSFYAMLDGQGSFGAFFPNGNDTASFPFTRSNLEANVDLTKGIGTAKAKGRLGWYVDLAASRGIAERVDVQPTANAGVVAFAANLPSSDTCSPTGTGRAFALSFGTGRSQVLDDNGANLVASMTSDSVIRDLAFQRVNGKVRVYTGNSGGKVVKMPTGRSSEGVFRQLNWREVRVTD